MDPYPLNKGCFGQPNEQTLRIERERRLVVDLSPLKINTVQWIRSLCPPGQSMVPGGVAIRAECHFRGTKISALCSALRLMYSHAALARF